MCAGDKTFGMVFPGPGGLLVSCENVAAWRRRQLETTKRRCSRWMIDEVKMMQDPISDRGRQRAPLDWRVLYDTPVE